MMYQLRVNSVTVWEGSSLVALILWASNHSKQGDLIEVLQKTAARGSQWRLLDGGRWLATFSKEASHEGR